MDAKSHLALARTCKTLYNYYNGSDKEQPFTFLCDTECCESEFSYYTKIVKSYIDHTTGWGGVKFILKTVSTNLQNSLEHPIKALLLDKSFKLPNGLDYTSLNVLILEFSDKTGGSKPKLSLGNFSNLKSLTLVSAILNDNVMSMLAEIPLLKVLYLYCCTIGNDNSQKMKMFKHWTTLEEIQLHHCIVDDSQPIKLPPQLERFIVEEPDGEFEQIDASLCTQLSCL